MRLAILCIFASVICGGVFGPTLAADEAAKAPNPAQNAAPPAESATSVAPAGTSTSASGEAPLAAIPAKSEEGGVALTKPGASLAAAGDDDSTATGMVDELRRRREEADAREKALDARETELKARETALDAELKKLQSIRDDIAKIEESRTKENDARVAKIVETVETMSPKAAAPLLAAMDEPLAVAAMGKIATPKLAKIMNVMEPRKSARLSELLAGVVRAKNAEVSDRTPARTASNGAAETTTKSTKGGEQDDGHSQ